MKGTKFPVIKITLGDFYCQENLCFKPKIN